MPLVSIGIDPGLSGAIVVIYGQTVQTLRFHDTPVLTIKSGRSLKKQMDVHGCAHILRELKIASPDILVTIEKVQAMPSQRKPGEPEEERRSMGVTSAFNFGWGFGAWVGIIAALEIPYQLVAPQTWKKRMMFGMEREKDASRQRAMQMFPQAAFDLQRKKDHNRADALLMAAYGANLYVPSSIPREAHPTVAKVQNALGGQNGKAANETQKLF